MSKAYRAVLWSYLGLWQSWLVAALWLLQLATYVPSSWRSGGGRDLFPLLFFAVGYTGAAIGVQTKVHLGAYRAALIPRFRGPHLVVATGLLALAVLPFPVVAALAGNSALGVLGLTVPLGALAFAACCRGGWRSVALGLVCVAVFVPAVSRLVTGLLGGQYPWAAAALALAGLWLLGDAVVFLGTMDEETLGYEVQFRGNLRQFRGHQARQSMSAAMRHLDRQNSIWLRLVDARLPETMPYVGDSRWRRIVHWRRAHANQWLTVTMPAIIWLMMLALQLGAAPSGADSSAALRGTLWVLVMLPPTLALNAWQARGGMLSRELTYPLRRRDFLLEQGASVLAAQGAAWLLLAAVMAGTLALLPGGAPWPELLVVGATTGPWQVIVFALMARLATLGSGLPLVAGLLLAAGAGMALVLGCLSLGSATAMVSVAGAVVLLAAASLVAAYRHWLRVDIP